MAEGEVYAPLLPFGDQGRKSRFTTFFKASLITSIAWNGDRVSASPSSWMLCMQLEP
jgi:hypothetical protein